MRLEKIASEYGENVEVVWKSFLLRPEPGPRSLEEHREYTKSWLRPAEQEESGFFTVWATENEPPTHSVPAHLAAKAAATFGEEEFHRFHLSLMEAYFRENRTISDLEVLADVAERSGIPADDFLSRLENWQLSFQKEVFSEHNEAVRLGVTGIPSVVVDDVLLIPGAVETDAYRKVIEERLALS